MPAQEAEEHEGAPSFRVPPRKLVAVEHPAILLNLDKGLETFGPQPGFEHLFESKPEDRSLPLWFRPDNPTSKPIVSQHAPSNNILLKITVPKRTGRKRKRGSNEPFSGDVEVTDARTTWIEDISIGSAGRYDTPMAVLHRMQDNPMDYHVDPVGIIKDTYRYRGLADHQFSNRGLPFLNRVAEHLLPMDVSKLHNFELEPGVDTRPGLEIIPPPQFTGKLASFHYNYEQNQYIRHAGVDDTGAPMVINTQGRHKLSFGHFIHHDTYPVPTGPKQQGDKLSNHVRKELLNKLREAMEERPIWTRRSLVNHLGDGYSDTAVKVGIQLVGYQFRGGPWRDAIIKYGVDPRSDSKYRIYQTLAFKLARNAVGSMKVSWQEIRRGQTNNPTKHQDRTSHLWDGESYSTDGKFWQVCDIRDPYLVKRIADAPVRPECEVLDAGWYHKSFWAKVKAYMKAKMVAIKHGRIGSDDDNPRKPGYIYSDYLFGRMRHIGDDVDDGRTTVSMDALLYPMLDVEGVRKAKNRPTRLSEMMQGQDKAEGTPSETRYTEADQGEGSTPGTGPGNQVGIDEGDLVAPEEDAASPDNAWNSDLEDELGSEVEGEEGQEDSGDSDVDGEENYQ